MYFVQLPYHCFIFYTEIIIKISFLEDLSLHNVRTLHFVLLDFHAKSLLTFYKFITLKTKILKLGVLLGSNNVNFIPGFMNVGRIIKIF
jgi:hypothetical protein